MRRLAVSIAALAVLWSCPSSADEPAKPAAEAGSLIGPVLLVSDIARSLKFYTDGLGMRMNMSMGRPERREYMIGFGGDPRQPGIILVHDDTSARNPAITLGHGYDRTVMRSANLDALAARLTAAGYAHSAIRDVAMGYRMMMASDPDGYRYELVQIAARP